MAARGSQYHEIDVNNTLTVKSDIAIVHDQKNEFNLFSAFFKGGEDRFRPGWHYLFY